MKVQVLRNCIHYLCVVYVCMYVQCNTVKNNSLTQRKSCDHLRRVRAVGCSQPPLVLELVVQREDVLGGREDGMLLDVLEAVLVLTEVVGQTFQLGRAKFLGGVPTPLHELRGQG